VLDLIRSNEENVKSDLLGTMGLWGWQDKHLAS